MAKANKMQPTRVSVVDYIKGVEPERRRLDAKVLDTMIRRVTGERPTMWGPSIIGYGKSHYRYETGREGDAFLFGFAPRKANLVLYIMPGFAEYEPLMKRLGKHSTSKSCLYVNKLDDIDMGVLEELVTRSVEHVKKVWPAE